MTTIDNARVEVAWDPAVSQARQILYRFIAMALADPRAGAWLELTSLPNNSLLNDAADLLRNEAAAASAELALGEQPLEELNPAPVVARLPASRHALNELFESTFGLLASSTCPPHETDYINSKFTFQRSHALADVSGFYQAFGLEPSPQRREQHDHIVLELEFMAFLLGLERRAAECGDQGGAQRAAICRDAARRFLHEHLAWWAPAFGRLLGRENPGGYYEAVGVLLGALIAAERSLCGIEHPRVGAAPSSVERPEECEGCQLGPQ
ncbi:MAG: molecular chaperone TorD family protein [Planctomycetes bacterium]|nr:molecular chaperone TorD family protein [Planctomycetota bacterium]